MQVYAVTFILLLGFTLHVSGVLYTHHQEYNFQLYLQPLVQVTLSSRLLTEWVAETIAWLVPLAVDTAENGTPDGWCIKHAKHVE